MTADGVDPAYEQPVIDREIHVNEPMPHDRVSGHFDGTVHRFSFYFPPKTQWDGRFFQNAYPLQDEHASGENIAFAAANGAYVVQTTGELGYAVAAAAARFSRVVAERHYGTARRIYGYIWGGSGGSFQTIGAIENTIGVWDGAVPFINGVPSAIPNNFCVRALAGFVLRAKSGELADAVRPGGTDPDADLDDVERAALCEATRLGVPLRAWEDFEYVADGGRAGVEQFLGMVRGMDPGYADDFWNAPGYLGSDPSALGARFRAAAVDHVATITHVDRDDENVATRLLLATVPANADTTGLEFTLEAADGTAAGAIVTGSLDPATRVITIAASNDPAVLSGIDPGATLRIDNRWFLALHAYHRYQVPRDASFRAWQQYRDTDGRPIGPQRDIEVGPVIAGTVTGGGTLTGEINAKVIIVDNLLDSDAFPWHGDWYAKHVEAALGNRCDDSFRLWFNDHAYHQDAPVNGPRAAFLVSYDGILQQALRDVSAWAERGVAPPPSTRYRVADSQVTVATRAADRRGVQPVVDLTVDGATRIDVPAGQPVTFVGTIEVPPGAGAVIATEWDFAGTGDFAAAPLDAPCPTVDLYATHTYATPGTYFPVLRATSERDGDANARFARVQNLGRVRVVVH